MAGDARLRSILEIINAVKDCQPATEEELRLALVAMANMELMAEDTARRLVEVIEEKCSLAVIEFRGAALKDVLDGLFYGRKKPPREWLGAAGVPGTPEHTANVKLAKQIFRHATGIDLDAPVEMES